MIGFFIFIDFTMNDDLPHLLNDKLDNPSQQNMTLFSFSNWISKGFWLALAYKWQLSFAALIIIFLQYFLLISAVKLFNTFEGDPYLLTMACVFAGFGLLFYPIISTGLSQIIAKMDKNAFKTAHLFQLLFSGFGAAFYRLLALGAFLLIMHSIFAFIMGALVALTQHLAMQSNTDLTSDAFIQYQNITLTLCFFVLYPFVIAPFIFSPLLVAMKPETSVFMAMRSSFLSVTEHFFNFALFIIFTLLIFVFFLIGLSIIPTILSGVISMLPWQNKFTVLQTLMIFPLTIIIAGVCFCFAWLNCALYQAYKQLTHAI